MAGSRLTQHGRCCRLSLIAGSHHTRRNGPATSPPCFQRRRNSLLWQDYCLNKVLFFWQGKLHSLPLARHLSIHPYVMSGGLLLMLGIRTTAG